MVLPSSENVLFQVFQFFRYNGFFPTVHQEMSHQIAVTSSPLATGETLPDPLPGLPPNPSRPLHSPVTRPLAKAQQTPF